MLRRSSIIDDNESASGDNHGSNNLTRESTVASVSDTASKESFVEERPNTIYNMFFGKLMQILKIDNSERTKIFNNKTEKMGPVMLDINAFSNLYEAWSAQCYEEI